MFHQVVLSGKRVRMVCEVVDFYSAAQNTHCTIHYEGYSIRSILQNPR